MRLPLTIPIAILAALAAGCSQSEPAWKPIFNGRDLDGWTVKICGFPAGVNDRNTVVVEDGMMRVNYSEYTSFSNEYVHIFYKEKLSHFRLRLEYRLHGQRVPGSKDFTELNSGVMFHSQSPESMAVDQEFPVSVEAQFLACDARETCKRTALNIASPGTNVVTEDGALREQHMTFSNAPAPLRDEWLPIEIEVHGSDLVLHKVNGEVVLRYSKPQIGGPNFLPEDYPLPVGTLLTDGYIALQGESHPVDFRNIELMILPDGR